MQGIFLMSVSRQGVIYWVVLEILRHLAGYTGIIWAQQSAILLPACLVISSTS